MKPPIAGDSALCEAASKAFVAAYLLSANVKRAEAAVMESIGSMNPENFSGERLVRGAVEAAIEPEQRSAVLPIWWEPAFSKLPLELRRVLRLPRYIRQCFVLRFLAGLPSERCADLLHSTADEVDGGTCVAMSEMAWDRTARFVTHSGRECSNN